MLESRCSLSRMRQRGPLSGRKMNRRRFLQWPSLEGWNAEGSPELGCISLEGGHAFCDGFEEGQVEQRDRERQGLVDEVAGVIQHKILDAHDGVFDERGEARNERAFVVLVEVLGLEVKELLFVIHLGHRRKLLPPQLWISFCHISRACRRKASSQAQRWRTTSRRGGRRPDHAGRQGQADEQQQPRNSLATHA